MTKTILTFNEVALSTSVFRCSETGWVKNVLVRCRILKHFEFSMHRMEDELLLSYTDHCSLNDPYSVPNMNNCVAHDTHLDWRSCRKHKSFGKFEGMFLSHHKHSVLMEPFSHEKRLICRIISTLLNQCRMQRLQISLCVSDCSAMPWNSYSLCGRYYLRKGKKGKVRNNLLYLLD